jgi:hypothetical protein
MRHANIRTTVDYYANVDDAAMQAVLGVGRNNSHHTARRAAPLDGAESPPVVGADRGYSNAEKH